LEDTSQTKFIIPAFFDFSTYDFEEVSLNEQEKSNSKGVLVILPQQVSSDEAAQELLTKLFGAIKIDFASTNVIYVEDEKEIVGISYHILDSVLVFGVDLKRIGIHIPLALNSAKKINDTLIINTNAPSELATSVDSKKQLWGLLKKYFLDAQ